MRPSTLLFVAALGVICFLQVQAAPKGKAAADAPKAENPVDPTKSGSATASDTNAKEEEAISSDTFSAKERELLNSKSEKHEFQAEVTRLMDIIINSLYKDREIFMREMISNAADALDKIRFLSVTDKAQLGQGDQADLDIRIKFDKDARTITITDKGIGMTKDHLIKHLGVVAKSGTTEFLEKMANAGDNLSLIGQFGVGFYSVYLVADKVTVISKHNDDPVQHVWESSADSSFTVAPDPRGNTLGRGTSIVLHLKDDASEFLSEQKLESLVVKYSQFTNFPIYLYTTKEVDVEVPDDSPDADKPEEAVEDLDAAKKDGEDTDGADTEKKEEKKPKTKTVKETRHEWKLLNKAKAIWTRSGKDVTDEEYGDFYQVLTEDDQGFLTKIHFSAEGDIAFKSILYIPKKAEANLYDRFYEKSTGLKLYVRRVMIAEEFDDFLPRYLNFVKGVVDSDDLPLNVNREQLAQHKVLKVMAKKLTRKVLEMLGKLAAGKKMDDTEEEEEEKKEGEPKDLAENEQYQTFWENFGKSIKLGVIDDRQNKAKLSKLLRFTTSKSEGKPISLESYVERMKENQKYIYYITGESTDAVANSPFMERLKKRDLEVIYMTDPLDEYVAQTLTEFDGNTLMSITKADLKLPGDEKEKETLEKLKEEYKPLTEWLKGVYGDRVETVTVSKRLGQSPCVLVTGQYGWSANMERIMKAQTFADPSKASYMFSKKTMELNPRHPLVQELKKKAAEDSKDKALEDMANLMYDAALVQSGFSIQNQQVFAQRVHRVMSAGLGVDPNAVVPEEPEPADDEPAVEEAPAEDEAAAVTDEDGQPKDEL